MIYVTQIILLYTYTVLYAHYFSIKLEKREREREKKQGTNSRNERGDFTADPENMKGTIWQYYVQLYIYLNETA